MSDYEQYMAAKPTLEINNTSGQILNPGQNGNCAVVGSIGLQTLNDLVTRAIVMQMAADAGLPPKEDDIKNELNERTKENPNYVRSLTAAGNSLDMIRNQIALDLATFNLETQGITVSDKEVGDYINNHPGEFKSVDMYSILVPDQATATKVDNDLKTGGDFPTVALKYAQPNAQTEIRQSVQNIEAKLPQMAKVLEPTPTTMAADGTTTDWLKFPGGMAKFRIIHESENVDDVMKKKVWKALMVNKGTQGKNMQLRVQQRMLAANIQIKVDSLKDQWDNLMANMKKAASAPPAASPTTPVGGTKPAGH